jgi:hypothetical protein
MMGSGKAYVMVPDEIYRVAKAANEPRVRIDLMTGQVEPPALATKLIRESAEMYTRKLPHLLESQSVQPQMVRSAFLDLTFDLANPRASLYHPHEDLPTFECTVTLDDDRGISHDAHPTNWCRE